MNDPLICAITMVRDDHFYFQIWMKHYSSLVGRDNLYVLVHGDDSRILELAAGANIIRVPALEFDSVTKPDFDKKRFFLINGIANGLSSYYNYVIVTDCDEMLVVDPILNTNIYDYLNERADASTITALGLNIFHKISEEPKPLNTDAPILSQRNYCQVDPLNTKPIITKRVIQRSEGNHASNDPKLYIGDGLFIFHLKFVDVNLTLETVKARYHAGGLLNKSKDDDNFQSTISKIENNVSKRYSLFDRLHISNRSFDFRDDIGDLKKSWRRRRFYFQLGYWKSIFSNETIQYSKHYRFNLFTPNECHRIPARFRNLF